MFPEGALFEPLAGFSESVIFALGLQDLDPMGQVVQGKVSQ